MPKGYPEAQALPSLQSFPFASAIEDVEANAYCLDAIGPFTCSDPLKKVVVEYGFCQHDCIVHIHGLMRMLWNRHPI